MQYIKIGFDNGDQLLQEIFDGSVLRYCDFDGNTTEPPPCGSRVVGEIEPSFTPPADPVATPDPEALIAAIQVAVQERLDSVARVRGYDHILSACSYAGAPNPFQSESQALLTWRGNVWATCYAVLADVQAGRRAIPTTGEMLGLLPAAP